VAKVKCPECDRDVTVTRGGILYKHGSDGVLCPASSEPAPGREALPPPAPPPVETIPGVDEYTSELDGAKPEPFVRPLDLNGSCVPTDVVPLKPPDFSQPALPFSQPASMSTRKESRRQFREMTELGQRVASELKQMFFQYNQRRAEDNRNAQATLGPSEIGTPCDRRLALSLMRFPAVNPGGDGWAAFVGTSLHAGVAEMLQWADGGSGRYAVEVPLTFKSVNVPSGTGDWLDRTLLLFNDHKMMGGWSLDKLKTDGPSETYRVQVHVYAYGARLRGDMVSSVGIVGWPRDKSTLDDLYVWTEEYRPEVARKALERVDGIAERVKELSAPLHPDGEWSAARPHEVAAQFELNASDCKFCPFHMPGAKSLKEGGPGCNGRE
jgi:hypothetical protein